MRPSGRHLVWALALTALLTTPAGRATAQEPEGPSESWQLTLLTGGGKICEGESVSRPTAEITFGGHIEKIGPGNAPMDYHCRWTIQFRDVQGTQFDGARFKALECRDVSVWAAGGAVDAAMRVVLDGELDGMPGWSAVLLVVDMTEPGAQDQIRIRLFDGRFIPGEPVPLTPVYDSNWEFSTYPGTSARTYLDSGNLQSRITAPWPGAEP